MKSMAIPFDLKSGLSSAVPSIKRKLSAMKNMFADQTAFESMVQKNDPLVYEFYDLHLPETDEEIAHGTSIVYPGKVGGEYFMTKGHFHKILNTGEVYLSLQGEGAMLMENPEGVCEMQWLKPGVSVYVPPRFAHRSVNTGDKGPLITFFAFRSDAGHDYGTIETKGFQKLLLEKNGKPELIDNPKWNRPA
jgi:glucose-6-phosphate isomerase